MSKKKQLNNRLNALFADMGEDKSPVAEGGEILPGWTWQCDAVGYYVACGSEVEKILGYPASSFLGQLMTKHQLSMDSSQDLMKAIGAGENAAIEITLHFINESGKLIPTRTKIFREEKISGEISGWSGFSQLLQSDQELHVEYPIEEIVPIPPSTPRSDQSPVGARSPSPNLGLALEKNQTLSVSSPYTGAGKQSLKQRQTVSYPSAPGIEAALAVPIPMTDKTIGLLEITDASPERE